MEALSYPDAAEMARLEGLSVRSLPLEEGALVATLEELGPADLVYLIPSFHNPTGRTLSAPARRAILEARERRGFRLLEDDTYGELRTGEASVPALRASDEEGAVLYLGSFSQILFPGVRLGYVLPPPELAGIFARVKALRSGSTSSAAQRLALSFLSRGGLDAALEASRPAIGARLARACRRIEEELPGRLYERPNGGIYLWVSTAPLSGEEARALGLPWGVAVADGGVFSVEPRRIEAVRLSVSSLPEGRIDEAIRRLARAWRGDESVPPRRVGPEGRS
jgi:GntR family transcriptional regulator/MocR family aminotransferase